MNCEDEDSIRKYFEERNKLCDLMVHEEDYLRERAKMFWLEEGDTNSKFFHASTSIRKKINHITYLKTDIGDILSTEQEMSAVVKEYFKKIFAGFRENNVTNRDPKDRVITNSQNRMMTTDVTFTEFSVTIKQMHPDKSSGLHGLNPAFSIYGTF